MYVYIIRMPSLCGTIACKRLCQETMSKKFRCNMDVYKIGKSVNVEKRLQTFQTANPSPLKIEYKFRCNDPRLIESQLHQRYISKQVKGEWFALSSNQVADIKRFGKEEESKCIKNNNDDVEDERLQSIEEEANSISRNIIEERKEEVRI